MKLSTAVFGVLIAGLLIIYNTLFDRIGIIKAFSQEMKDYFENTLQTRLERDYIYPELAKTQASGLVAASEFAAHAEETATGPDGVTASAVDIERRHAAAREPRVAGRPKEKKHPALCLEEEIIDEILAEYLS